MRSAQGRRPNLDLPALGARRQMPRPAEPASAGTSRSVRASHALQRSARRRRLHVADAEARLLARLIDQNDVSSLLPEILRGARVLGRARSAELVLGRNAASTSSARRAEATTARASEAGGFPPPVTLVLPLQHAGRRLGVVRLGLQRASHEARLGVLRRYLAHAGAALARLLAQERVLRQQKRYEALLDSLPDACLLILSDKCTVQGVRGHARALFGTEPAALLGLPLVGSEGKRGLLRLPRARLRELLAVAHQSGKAETESWLRAVGRDIQVQVSLVDLGANGERVCVLRDLTEVKAMELALLRRNDELTQAAERLREIDTLKNEFLSNVSHELRTPLTAIIAYSEALLLTPPEPETQREFLSVVAEQGHKLQRLIGGLLDIAKVETLATELKLQLGSLNAVVQSAVVTVRPLADKNHIRIEAVLAPDLPDVYLDELRAQQIVWNLLTNAIKFSSPDTTVRVRTWTDDGQVWTAVTDQGIGIAPEHHKLIFEKFVQVDGSSTRRQGGVGLGLDLVRHLVELHGGRVQVDSSAGAGSTFTFGIPVEKRKKSRLAGGTPVVVGSRHGRSGR